LRHHILMEYLPHSHDHSFAALAQRYNVKGGKRTVQRWYDRWDGTVQSQQHQLKAGRPRLLSAAQIHQHITQPILARNRSHRPVHYDELWQSTKASTGTDLSLRTVQRYGKEITRARDKATRAWTAAERTCSHT
jgi:transposase